MTIYSRTHINRIGEILTSDKSTADERENALQTLNDWRALHFVPLNTFQANLRKYVKEVTGKRGIVAQRLKRVPTILDKIKNRQQQMFLGRMQDIGGLRAIVQDIKKLREIEKKYERSKTKHYLERKKDYINDPQESGYRGIHIIYKYNSPEKPEYNGLYIEIQLRTRLQHLWATAVETVGFFFQEALKSSQGNKNWLDFFKLVSAVFAFEEKEKPFFKFQSFTKEELIRQLDQFIEKHRIQNQLKTIQIAKLATKNPQLLKAAYWVIETVLNGNSVIKIHPFLNSQQDSADLTYRQLEQSPECKSGKKQVVLVSVDSVSKIEKAYPNFFGDIDDFVKELQRIQRPV
jgi:ppGpp synthetase/RelA/SpoT-type nucleotidyltranferase